MLVLERRPGECITVTDPATGNALVIRVVVARHGVVRLGFDDPARNFEIQRQERRRAVAHVGSGGAG